MALPHVLPNPTNFLGVALVVNRNRDGPRFVFHYPGNILSPVHVSRSTFGVDQFDDDEIFTDHFARDSALGSARDSLPNTGELARWNYDDHLVTENGTQFVPWEYVAGLPTKALEGILTPSRAFHKKRFQITLDSVCYVSCPIHVPASGFWGREKNKKGKTRKSHQVTDKRLDGGEGTFREVGVNEDKEDKASSMTMFSLVFIFNPQRHEASDLLDLMYTHVIREVNKVFKYCQESSDFVWQECKRILQLKDRARERRTKMSLLWDDIVSNSSLAASMRDVYEAISCNKIAVLELNLGNGSVAHSVQIPMPFHVGDVQLQGTNTAKGLWLTTANVVSSYEAIGGLAAFDKCFALLLTDDDDKKMVAELQARGDKAATAMIELVKAAKPTLSFYQISQLPDTMLTIQQIRAYAQHFIYWRRAIAVPPIHARDIYVLSPNCDLRNLSRATASYANAFPFAPPLPDFLAGLSAVPRPYKSFCPSKSLRPAYLRVLSWLIRGGWVCQLCTFCYVVVWPEIQYEVEYALESEDLARIKKRQQQQHRGEGQPRALAEKQRQKHANDGSSESDVDAVNEDFSALSDSSLSSVSMLEQDRNGHNNEGEPQRGPSAAEHAAERARRQRLAEKAAHNLAERATAHARKPNPEHTEHPSINNAPHLVGMTPYVILDASKPTGRDSLYLSAIERRLRASHTTPPPASKKDLDTGSLKARGSAHPRSSGGGDDTKVWNGRVADMWPVFWKYFNGRSALERIALLEDIKRKDVWNLLSAMSEYLLCVRHW